MRIAGEHRVTEFTLGPLSFKVAPPSPEDEPATQHPTVTPAPQRTQNPYTQLLGELPRWPKSKE